MLCSGIAGLFFVLTSAESVMKILHVTSVDLK
jgi:hypothetical protein